MKALVPKVVTFSWGDGVELRFSTDEWHEYYRLAMQLTPRAITMLSSKSGWLTDRFRYPRRPDDTPPPITEEDSDFLFGLADGTPIEVVVRVKG